MVLCEGKERWAVPGVPGCPRGGAREAVREAVVRGGWGDWRGGLPGAACARRGLAAGEKAPENAAVAVRIWCKSGAQIGAGNWRLNSREKAGYSLTGRAVPR